MYSYPTFPPCRLRTVQTILTERSTGTLSVIPFLALLCTCVVRGTYGLLIDDVTVITPNVIGLCASVGYTLVYARFHTGSLVRHYFVTATIVGMIFTHECIEGMCFPLATWLDKLVFVYAAITGSVSTLLPEHQARHVIGLAGCVFAVLLMSSPLATILTVFRDKSTASMTFLVSLVSTAAIPNLAVLIVLLTQATFFNASTWLSYGTLVAHDPYIYVPNILGLAASLLQLSLFAYYPATAPVPPVATGSPDAPPVPAEAPERPE